MKIRTFFLSMLLLASLSLWAQEENEAVSPKKIRYTLILEGGFNTASPKSINGEFVTMHGISINKQHIIALAAGIAGGFANQYGSKRGSAETAYIPLYLQYRYHINPKKGFSPIVTASLGGIIAMPYNERNKYVYDVWNNSSVDCEPAVYRYGGGIYSEFAAGFKAGNFFLKGGISCTPMKTTIENREQRTVPNPYYDPDYWYSYDPYYTIDVNTYKKQWIFPLGISFKVGFTF